MSVWKLDKETKGQVGFLRLICSPEFRNGMEPGTAMGRWVIHRMARADAW